MKVQIPDGLGHLTDLLRVDRGRPVLQVATLRSGGRDCIHYIRVVEQTIERSVLPN